MDRQAPRLRYHSAMTQTRIAKDDLSPATRDLVDRVQRGELAIVESGGEEQVVLLDAVDFRLLRALAAYATRSAEEPQELEFSAIRHYLDDQISLGKAAELLHLSRFDLIDRFQRLGIPLRMGSASLEEARAEVEAARKFQ